MSPLRKSPKANPIFYRNESFEKMAIGAVSKETVTDVCERQVFTLGDCCQPARDIIWARCN